MSFEIRVPASSANLGPGFDSLAVALALYLRVVVDPGGTRSARDAGTDLFGGEDLIAIGMRRAAEHLGVPLGDYGLETDAQIPVARGLGSSAAAIVAGLQAGALLAGGRELSVRELIDVGGAVEGHADNIAAAVLGGITAAIETDTGFVAAQIAAELPWRPLLFVPASAAFTHVARSVLPRRVTLRDASANVGRTALLVKALRDGDAELVRWAMDDRLHQPYRAQLFPHLLPIIERAGELGAVGGCLSGAGPTVLLLVPDEQLAAVSAAIEALASELDVPGDVRTPELDREGVVVQNLSEAPA